MAHTCRETSQATRCENARPRLNLRLRMVERVVGKPGAGRRRERKRVYKREREKKGKTRRKKEEGGNEEA